ncbi:MAG: hypothetical protein GC159_21520, partial [Phycisphaera sp.]|nr:hypothetical protein [Phycisphaera sp.]
MPASPRKRRQSYNVPGHAHFLTFSCYRRWPMLNRDRSRRWVIEAIDAARNTLNLAVWAYVIMPEHLHLLIYPRSAPYEMKDILTALKRPVSDAAKAHLIE